MDIEGMTSPKLPHPPNSEMIRSHICPIYVNFHHNNFMYYSSLFFYGIDKNYVIVKKNRSYKLFEQENVKICSIVLGLAVHHSFLFFKLMRGICTGYKASRYMHFRRKI
jgi:hypothetical protein